MAYILIIEDDLHLVDDLVFFLNEGGHSCKFYARSDDVIKNLDKNGQFNWIILDIMMIRGTLIGDSSPEMETGEIIYK